jgi:hypothetical protein
MLASKAYWIWIALYVLALPMLWAHRFISHL